MDTVRYDQLISGMKPELPGAESGLILNALKLAGRTFFRRSGVWRVTLPAVNAVALQDAYTLTMGTNLADIEEIDAVRINTAAGVTDGIQGYTVDPLYYFFTAPATLTFTVGSIPQESVTGGIEVDAYLVPKFGSAEVPAILFSRYAEGIRAKAIYDLKVMVKVPWSDRDGASAFQSEYNNALNRAISDRDRKGTSGGWGITG